MGYHNTYLRIFVTSFFLFCQSTVYVFGQDTHDVQNVEISNGPFTHSFFSFSLSPYIVNKAKASPLKGAYHLKTIYMPGFEAGPDYHVNINRSYSLIVGLHGGAAARNYKLFISKSDFTPNFGFNVNEDGQLSSEWDFYMSVPIGLEKRWFTKNGSF